MRAAHKKFPRYMFVIALLCILPIKDANAQRGSTSRSGGYDLCTQEEPKVVVKLATSKTKYHKNYSARTINAIHNASGGGTILGLAGGPLEIETRGQFAIHSKNGKACIQIKSIEVLFWTKPSIIIASNFKKGTCEYKEIFAHEQRHVRTTRKFVREYAPKLRKEVQEAIRTSRQKIVVGEDKIEDGQKKLQEPILARISQFQSDIMPVLQGRQAQIDTPEEYKRVSDQCDNWGKSLARGG